MRQAIEEGFILDVLKNYTPYKLAYRLAYHGEEVDEQEVEKAEGRKQLARWMRLNPYNIEQKVAIVVEHFRAHISAQIGGRAKAMVRHRLAQGGGALQAGDGCLPARAGLWQPAGAGGIFGRGQRPRERPGVHSAKPT